MVSFWMVLKVFSVCLMVLDLDRKKVNLIHLWILCVQGPAGEMPNNFPTQSYLKINTRVFVTQCARRHQSHISGNLPGLNVGMMVRAETEVGTEGATNGFFHSQCRENGCDYPTLKLCGLGGAELQNTNACCSAQPGCSVQALDQLSLSHQALDLPGPVKWPVEHSVSPGQRWWFTVCCSLPWELWSCTDLRWSLWVTVILRL